MNAKKCDRCGKFFELNDPSKKKYCLCKYAAILYNQLDLCDECSEELTAWFNKKRSQVHFEAKLPGEEGWF